MSGALAKPMKTPISQAPVKKSEHYSKLKYPFQLISLKFPPGFENNISLRWCENTIAPL
jgi:hypothetical protein